MNIAEILDTLPESSAEYEGIKLVTHHIRQSVGAATAVASGLVSGAVSRAVCQHLEQDALRMLMPHCVYAAQVARLAQRPGQDGLTATAPPPTLCRMIKTVLDRIGRCVGHWQTGIARYMAWRAETFGETPTAVTTQVFGGETHNGGQFLFRISDDLGNDFVYKPVSLRASAVAASIVSSMIAPHLSEGLSVPTFYPVGVDYGFIGFLPSDNRARSRDEVRRFFYMLGAWVAISHCLRMPDMHFENVLVSNRLPVVADLETAFYRSFYVDSEEWDIRTSGFLSLGHTAGVFGGGRVREIHTHVRRHAGGRMMMGYAEEKLNEASRLYYHDTWATPLENIDPLKAGFSAAFDIIMRCRDEILAHVAAESRSYPLLVRCVFRYTWDYVVMGQWYAQPSMTGENDAKVRARCARNDIANSAMPALVAACEYSDIADGDVPYFYANYGDQHLYHWTGRICEDHFDMTGAERMTRHFEHLATLGRERTLEEFDMWANEASALITKQAPDVERG